MGMKRRCCILTVSLMMVVLMASMALPAAKSVVKGVRWARRDGGVRVVVDMTSPAKYRIERQEGKVVLLMPGADLSTKVRSGKLSSPGRTWRTEKADAGVRLVIDTGGSATKLRHFTMKAPHRIVLDLRPALPEKSAGVTEPGERAPGKIPEKRTPQARVPVSSPEPAKSAPATLEKAKKSLWPLERVSPGKGLSDRIEIPILEKDLAVNSVFNTQISYFQVSPSWLVRDCTVELTLSHSQMTDTRFSNLTVEINGLPVKTVPLDGRNLWKGRVTLKVPADYFEPGPNFITLRSFMRANDIPCRDIDNPGNWLRVHRDSRIVLRYGQKATFLPADFPEPFFQPDSDRREPCLFVLPDRAGLPEIQAALLFLTDWARNYAMRDFQPRLARISELTERDVERSHLIFLGSRKAFQPAVLAPFAVGDVDWGENLLISAFAGREARARLLVTADKPEGVLLGVRALLTPEVRTQMRTHRLELPLSTPLPVSGPGVVQVRREDITLQDIFIDDIVFRGTTSHVAPFTFYIPPQWEIGGKPYLMLRFHHSPALRPDRSSLTVDFGEVPQRAVKLGPENSDGGRLVVPIPDSYNGGDFLEVTLRGYLDIGSADCNHNYSEAAWLVVDRDSTLHIPHGDRPLRPYLESLPFAFGTGPLEVFLDPALDGSALSGLATILTFWQAELTEPLRFSLRDVPDEAVSTEADHHRLFFGDWKTLEKEGLSPDVVLSADGKSLVSGADVPVVAEFARDGAFFQLMERGKDLDLMVGWAERSPHPEILGRALGSLEGETALVSSEGAVVGFYPRRGAPPEEEVESSPVETRLGKLWDFLQGERRVAAILGFVSAIVILGLFVALVRLIRRGH